MFDLFLNQKRPKDKDPSERWVPVARQSVILRQGLRSKTSKMLELKFQTFNYVNKNYRRELK